MEDQQFILRWHYHETTLLRNLPQLLESEILTDITLSADNQIIKAHRIVLATCSSYFLQLFQNMGSLQHPVIILHNTSYDDLRCLISFIYRGQCLITKNQLPSLLSLAKLLQIQGLCDMKLPQETAAEHNPLSQESHPVSKDILSNNSDDYLKMRPNLQKRFADELEQYTKNKYNKEVKEIETESPKVEPDHAPDASSSRKTTKDLLYKCFLCGKYLSNQYNLRVHMETHEEGCYVCQSCPHVSRSRDALRKHVSYRHQEQYSIKKRKKFESPS